MCRAWELAVKAHADAQNADMGGVSPIQASLPGSERLRIFSEYQKRYDLTIPSEGAPLGGALGWIHGLRGRRPREAAPFALSIAVQGAEVSSAHPGCAPLANSGAYVRNVQQRKNAIWAKSPQCYVRTLLLLPNSYTLSSCLDPEGIEWIHKDTADLHLAKLQTRARADCAGGNSGWE